MNILVFSISSPPEKTGIGKYNGEMIEYFAAKGHETRLLTTLPYYPEWRLADGYKSKIYSKEIFKGVEIIRVWSFLPSKITPKARIIKELSFYFISLFYLFIQKFKAYKPDLIIYIAPPFFLPFITRLLYHSSKHIYHIQDFEVDAALELNMLPPFMESFLKRLERLILQKMDMISTISEGMLKKLKRKSDLDSVFLFPNWSDTSLIYPSPSHWLHEDLNLDIKKKLVVYSGNIGEKQGLDKLPVIIDRFKKNNSLHFVIIGEGAYKLALIETLENTGLSNYSIRGLVEKEELNFMLNSSFIQLVLQKNEGADAFLPSKLTNIFAAGIPSIVTTNPGTGLYDLIKKNKCGIPVNDDINDIIEGLEWAIKNPLELASISENAVKYSKNVLEKELILSSFEKRLRTL